MTLAAGTKLGPYEILSPLGAGGMDAPGGRCARSTPITLVTNWTAELEKKP